MEWCREAASIVDMGMCRPKNNEISFGRNYFFGLLKVSCLIPNIPEVLCIWRKLAGWAFISDSAKMVLFYLVLYHRERI
jgi:hypothetical protein